MNENKFIKDNGKIRKNCYLFNIDPIKQKAYRRNDEEAIEYNYGIIGCNIKFGGEQYNVARCDYVSPQGVLCPNMFILGLYQDNRQNKVGIYTFDKCQKKFDRFSDSHICFACLLGDKEGISVISSYDEEVEGYVNSYLLFDPYEATEFWDLTVLIAHLIPECKEQIYKIYQDWRNK